MWVYSNMWDWFARSFGSFEVWTTTATMLAAIAAVATAYMSFAQSRRLASSELVPSLYFIGNLDLALSITNERSTAKHIEVFYRQIAGPKVVDYAPRDLILRNGIDILRKGESRDYEIGRVTDQEYFSHNRQALAYIIDSATDSYIFRPPVTIEVCLSWNDAAYARRRSDRFTLIADSNLFTRSVKAQVFPSQPF